MWAIVGIPTDPYGRVLVWTYDTKIEAIDALEQAVGTVDPALWAECVKAGVASMNEPEIQLVQTRLVCTQIQKQQTGD